MLIPAIFKSHNLIAAQSTRLNDLLQKAGKSTVVEFTDTEDAFDRAHTRDEFLRQLGLTIDQLAYSLSLIHIYKKTNSPSNIVC